MKTGIDIPQCECNCGVLTFAKESVGAVLSDPALEELIAEHLEELNGTLHYEPQLDRTKYCLFEQHGQLACYTARTQDGSLVGYSTYFVGNHPQNPGSVRACQDSLFLRRMYRRGNVGMRFIEYCCDQLKARGVDYIYQYVPVTTAFGPVLKRLGFEQTEEVWLRRT